MTPARHIDALADALLDDLGRPEVETRHTVARAIREQRILAGLRYHPELEPRHAEIQRLRWEWVLSYDRLCWQLAESYARPFPGVPPDDLHGWALEGVYEGVLRFDPDRGLRVITYVRHWAKAYLLNAVNRAARTTSIPKHLGGRLIQISKRRAAGEPLTVEEQQLWAVTHASSLDDPLTPGSEARLGDMLPADDPSPLDAAIDAERDERLHEAIEQLPTSQRLAAEAYLAGQSHAEHGRAVGITRWGAHMNWRKAREKLRNLLEVA